jgi:hypothetical protein
MASLDFCPSCDYYLYQKATGAKSKIPFGPKVTPSTEMFRICHNCGYQAKDSGGGLIMETDLQEKTSEGYKILLNEFTKMDPTLPHLDTIKCPNAECGSNRGTVKADIIYMKYDPVNLKYLYLCNVEGCGAQWRSKGA